MPWNKSVGVSALGELPFKQKLHNKANKNKVIFNLYWLFGNRVKLDKDKADLSTLPFSSPVADICQIGC